MLIDIYSTSASRASGESHIWQEKTLYPCLKELN